MIVKWQAPEYNYFKKDVGWYWLVVIFAIIIISIAFWQRNFLFVVFTILAVIALIILGRKEPLIINFELNEQGIKIEKNTHSKDKFKEFAIKKEGGDNSCKLQIISKSKFTRYLILPIPKEKFDEIRKYCLNFWTEAEYKESLVDELADWVGF